MKKRILVVDDDYAILESLQLLLEDAGYEVITAGDSSIVYKNFHGKIPDVILLDYWLPRENGSQVTKKLKNMQETKHIPVIIISASYNIKDLVKEAGADDFLAKPYDMDVLLAKVKHHLR